ncbi:MAG: hypothetical protein HETSPECPRED_007020 [Heterodermia speciosa]|uniref:CNNM transmembrane domain-containing protein n=1 Tax=Heterodermia speciosa TaxID=116794 RepID=A0A8H3EKN4_9LECA|nr:MAG: hypothetical protein HETSPECPRED_007020 [Heterodermia speciosa]
MVPAHQTTNGYALTRPLLLSGVRLLIFATTSLPLLGAAPLAGAPFTSLSEDEEPPIPPDSPTLWIYLAVADEIYLQVIKTSGEGSEKNHAAKVLRLLKRGKHWVLVTLLLGNVITNETLPIVLDRSLGGGWPAVLGSTVLIVIFGEIIPQSICVRHGLPIGAWMSPLVLILMYIMAPVAWPTAKLLDRLLGEDHGTTYKKAGLKTLVTLHKTLGAAGEQLNSDEVTIISAVLDLKAKPVGAIMTPMDQVFTMSADTILDQSMTDSILSAGYSRIPIHAPGNEQNFVGMLLVKILITYDPEDCQAVSDFALATLPETRSETSCLDILNFFQEGKSHMVLVSEYPGEDTGALGVVTLEDVIEELIGEEIIDESDVYVDVPRAIRRHMPAPQSRVPKGAIVTDPSSNIGDEQEDLIDLSEDQKSAHPALRRLATNDGSAAKANGNSNPTIRRTSSVASVTQRDGPKKSKDHAHNLGPSNLASRPRTTRYNTVKIKPGGGGLSDAASRAQASNFEPRRLSASAAPRGGVGEGLLNSAGLDAKDGVMAVQAGYGTMGETPPKSKGRDSAPGNINELSPNRTRESRDRTTSTEPRGRDSSQSSTVGSMRSLGSRSKSKRGVARSGSLSENVVHAGGIKKTVLETTSSSDDVDGSGGSGEASGAQGPGQTDGADDAEIERESSKPDSSAEGVQQSQKKKRRRKKRSGKKGEE